MGVSTSWGSDQTLPDNQTPVPNPSGPNRLAPRWPHLCFVEVSEGGDRGGAQHPLLPRPG